MEAVHAGVQFAMPQPAAGKTSMRPLNRFGVSRNVVT
jgi:hypothetical protein